MNDDNTQSDAERVKLLFEKIKKEKGDLYAEAIAPLQGTFWMSSQFQYNLRLGIFFFFVAVSCFTAYLIVSRQDYDPGFLIAFGTLVFISYKVLEEAKRKKRYPASYTIKGIVTGKIEKFHHNIPLQYAVLSEKKRIRINDTDYRNLALGDLVLVTFVDPNNPMMGISVKKLGSILEDSSIGTTPPRPRAINRSTMRYYLGQFALGLLLINAIFLFTYGARTIAANQFVERYTLFYWALAAISLAAVCYFIIYPLLLERVPKVWTRVGALLYFCFGALFSTAPLLIAMDHFLVNIKMVESPEAFGPDDQQYFMFKRYHLHRELQYDSVYYRYDRGARGQSPQDEFNYFAIIPLSATREDTAFSLLLYRSVSFTKSTGSAEEIRDTMEAMYVQEYQKTRAFPFDSITYYNRSEGGTLTKYTLGQLVGDRLAEIPFQSTADAVLLVPSTDNTTDEGPSYLLGYVILFAVILLFSIAFS